MEGFASLFADSASSGKLANFSLTDFGIDLKKAKLSFGNVNLGIYKQGPRKFPRQILHDKQVEKELYQLVSQLKYKGHYYASLRNFKNSVIMNFTAEDFARGLYFYTFTFNNFREKMPFSFAPWRPKSKECLISNCQQEHYYQIVSPEISSFLAEKKTAKKRLGRDLEGVNDLFASTLRFIHESWKPTNFKWVAVPELHKCQIPCHWPKKKTKKSKWKEHNQAACHCTEKHECLRNWHIHMLATDFLPERYQHDKCGLGKFADNGSPRGCWDHRGYIAHDIWPYGLVDMKRISHLKVSGKPIRSAEAVIAYLIKYLAKSFQMRENKELAERVGLLSGMGIYKFFRVIYGYEGERTYIQEKRQKPAISSAVFINNNYGDQQEIEQEFSPYFTPELCLKKEARQILHAKEPNFNLSLKSPKINDLLKLCLRFSSRSSIKKNHFWKPCDISEQTPLWKQGKGWQVNCPITKEHHCEPIIRWDFEFKGTKSYTNFQTYILPALNKINLPQFQKFKDYQIKEEDYIKFAKEASLPWNRELSDYELLEEYGENITDKWKESIPHELIYNHIYLKEIRSQISHTNYSWGLDTDKAMARYADY